MATSGSRHWRRAAAVVALVTAAACAPEQGGGGGGGTTTTAPVPDEPFTVLFIGDSEPRMRGNTDAEVAGYVAELVSLRGSTVRTFDYDGGRYRIDPKLVILGGDISADRTTSIATDLPIWQPLYDNGIGFIAGFGNHDWEPRVWSDGSLGYSVAGHQSNEATTAFTRETYRRSALVTPQFTYQEIGPTATYGPVTFRASFRGVDIVNFNTFLYQPSYTYPDGWPLSCNLLGGGAGCQIFVSAEGQIQRMDAALSTDQQRPTLFVQHYPLTTDDGWWSDEGASGTTVTEKKARLLDMAARYPRSVLLAGHNHAPAHNTYPVAGRVVDEYVAPYFGGANGDDPSVGGGFVALLVSPSQGILEVKTFPTGI